jgi:hypothetical protein
LCTAFIVNPLAPTAVRKTTLPEGWFCFIQFEKPLTFRRRFYFWHSNRC